MRTTEQEGHIYELDLCGISFKSNGHVAVVALMPCDKAILFFETNYTCSPTNRRRRSAANCSIGNQNAVVGNVKVTSNDFYPLATNGDMSMYACNGDASSTFVHTSPTYLTLPDTASVTLTASSTTTVQTLTNPQPSPTLPTTSQTLTTLLTTTAQTLTTPQPSLTSLALPETDTASVTQHPTAASPSVSTTSRTLTTLLTTTAQPLTDLSHPPPTSSTATPDEPSQATEDIPWLAVGLAAGGSVLLVGAGVACLMWPQEKPPTFY